MKQMPLKAAALGALLFLSACQTAEERAEGYYQSALELLDSGDTERALVEFRNVFAHDGFHKDARTRYAATLYDMNRIDDAYGQYLRLVEQYPDSALARLTLAEIALSRGDWREVNRHNTAAQALAPALPRSRALAVAAAYADARRSDDAVGATTAATRAETLLETLPDSIPALRVVIDAKSRGPLPETALPLIDHVLALKPASFEFHTARLRLLTKLQDDPAAIAQLEAMFSRFPTNENVRTALVNWHLSQENYAEAETILRALAGDPITDAPGHLTVMQFLRSAFDDATALKELETLIAATAGTEIMPLYQAMAIMIAFEADTTSDALPRMQALTADLPQSDQSRRIKAMYAQMLVATGDEAGARDVVDAILAEDRTNIAALKLRATWSIAADRPDVAITDLRTALSQDPRDADVMMLLATAHERTGFPELAGERLALAVQVSDAAPVPSLRYARFLIRDNRTQAAAAVLRDARRTAPANLELLSVLADLELSQKNWSGATALLDELREMSAIPRAKELSAALESAILSGQNRTDESLAVLQEQLGDLDEDGRAAITIALAQIRAGKVREARTYLNNATSSRPKDMTLRMLAGSVAMMDGDADAAESVFRTVLNANPGSEAAVRLLYSLLHLQGRDVEKAQVLNAGLAVNDASPTLLWIKAGALEQRGEIDGAVAIYEQLYTNDSSNVIVANNLASLLATHYDDAASLERAFRIARRLRGMDIPAFQDTYGWIMHRRGDYTTALEHLRPAALGLPGDPLVHYHLGLTYHKLGDKRAAIETLTLALELAEDSDLPQFAVAREVLAALLQ